MKNHSIISMKVISMLLVPVAILMFTSCDGKPKDKVEVEQSSSITHEISDPPSTDIHTAAFMGNLEAIQEHINAGSDLNAKDSYGSCPLTIAATFNKQEIAKALIDAGADLSSTNNDGSTPLHTAAFLCRIEIVEMLLEKGADKSLVNNYGSTALQSISGPWETVEGIYDQFGKDLGPFGLKLDYDYLKETRPKIAAMLQ